MGHMDVLGTELTCDRLRHRAQSEFRAGKRGKTRSAAHAGGRAGEENVALAAGKHQPRCLATCKKAGIAGHFPHFAAQISWALSPPMKSPAPTTATVAFRFFKGSLQKLDFRFFQVPEVERQAPRSDSANFCLRIFPVEVAGSAGSTTISHGRL